MEMRYRFLLGDSAKKLLELDPDSVDSLICDPPAGIAFMGKTWDQDHGGRDGWIAAFANIFGECLRVMKPGAHGLVWALPRTSHWTATALENAGFELRDCIVHLYGTGFPKSMSISKAIDKAAGAKREDLGPNPSGAGRNKNITGGALCEAHESDRASKDRITAPATPDAERWDGWGTALKPASEHWLLVRKPLSERTVAANVLAHGTGGLNIDASRIGTEERTYGGSGAQPHKLLGREKGDTGIGYMDGSGKDLKFTATGRWPANMVLSHSPECKRVGEKKVKAIKGGSAYGTVRDTYGKYNQEAVKTDPGYGDADGLETVPDWDCAPGCPVKELDEQSGELKSGAPGVRRKAHETASMSGTLNLKGSRESGFGDSGTASRFFYQAKAPNREKWVYCRDCKEAFPVKEKKDHQHDHKDKKHLVQHPTPKSVELMRYFVKLITPPQGVVLDPFMGTGSTGVACLLDDFRFIGIEMDREYLRIAKRRLMELTRAD